MTMQERQSTWRQKCRTHMSLGVKATIKATIKRFCRTSFDLRE
jgi:hypothetical protein